MRFFSSRNLVVTLPIFALLIFLSNSGGPASNGNYYTGAPSAGGGTEGTCSTCHNSGRDTYGEPVINVNFSAAGAMEELTEYQPGQTYVVTVAVGYDSIAPAAYGFSSQILSNATSPATAAGTLGNPGTGTQLSAAGNGRVYAEHRTPGTDSLFTFEWTAPAAGTGAVQLYVAGNLVNRAGGTSGDSGSTAPTIVTLTEGIPSSVRTPGPLPHRLFPNPTHGNATLTVTIPQAGDYHLLVTDLTGRALHNQRLPLLAGPNQLTVPADRLPAGVYAIALRGATHQLLTRLVVR